MDRPHGRLEFAEPKKLARLPKSARVHKRPLNHPPIAPPRTGAHIPKVVYISSSAPFVSVIKRTRKFLSEIDKRSMGDFSLTDPDTTMTEAQRLAALGKIGEHRGEVVLLKATGKAIEKALRVALHFQSQEDCLVRIKTGSVGTVDDVETEEASDTRVRMTSMLEVGVSLR